jgi:hypothetical protein
MKNATRADRVSTVNRLNRRGGFVWDGRGGFRWQEGISPRARRRAEKLLDSQRRRVGPAEIATRVAARRAAADEYTQLYGRVDA